MTSPKRGAALVETALVLPVVLLVVVGILAVHRVIDEEGAVDWASMQAADAAVRAPSERAAVAAADAMAAEEVRGWNVQDLQVTVDTGGFHRNGVLTVTTEGYPDLSAYPLVAPILRMIHLRAVERRLVEPLRSRST